MREFTKSFISYSLASTILGLQQMTQMVTSAGDLSETTHVMNDVTATMITHMNRPMRTTYQCADMLQRSSVDILLGGWIPSGDAIRSALGSRPPVPSGAPVIGARQATQEAVGPLGSWDWEDSRAPQPVSMGGYAHADIAG
jgi:hypothetical protein